MRDLGVRSQKGGRAEFGRHLESPNRKVVCRSPLPNGKREATSLRGDFLASSPGRVLKEYREELAADERRLKRKIYLRSSALIGGPDSSCRILLGGDASLRLGYVDVGE